MKFKCLACGKEIEQTSRCDNCGVVYDEREPVEPIRDYIEIGTVADQMYGLIDLRMFLIENNVGKDKMVEIGTWLGASVIPFADYFKEVFCIDHWHGDKNTPNVFMGCQFNLKNYKNISMVREWSAKAVNLFEDESIDFIYIDGDHRPEFVREDIVNWWPKLKKDGVMAGHDYGRGNEIGVFDFRGLTMVVNEIFGNKVVTFKDTSWAVIKK